MKKALKDYSIVLFGTGFSRGLAFLNSIIIARMLGTEDFGRFSIFFTLNVVVWIFPQSFDAVFLCRAKTANSVDEKNQSLKISLFCKLAYGLAVLLAAYPVAWFAAVHMFKKPELIVLIAAAMLSGVFQSFLMTVASIFQEKENFTVFAFSYSLYTLSILLFLGLMHWRHITPSLNLVILIHVVVSLGIGAASLLFIFKKNIVRLFPLDEDALKGSLALGKWILGIEILSFVFTRADLLFLGRTADFHMLGIYAAAQQVTMFVSMMLGSMSGIMLPKAAAALTSKEQYGQFKKEALIIACLINAVIAVLFIFAPVIVAAFYGSQYNQASDLARILLIGWAASVFYAPFSFLFYALNEAKSRFALEVVAFLTAIVLMYVLYPRMGAAGAAMAISAVLIVKTITCAFILRAKLRLALS